MSDPWAFWRSSLDGETPETTPGTPHAGYYLMRRRETRDNPNPRPGDPRKKVTTHYNPVAIWQGNDDFICLGWLCLEHAPRGPIYRTEADVIDESIFSRCCRSPLTYEDYLAKVAEREASYERADNDA